MVSVPDFFLSFDLCPSAVGTVKTFFLRTFPPLFGKNPCSSLPDGDSGDASPGHIPYPVRRTMSRPLVGPLFLLSGGPQFRDSIQVRFSINSREPARLRSRLKIESRAETQISICKRLTRPRSLTLVLSKRLGLIFDFPLTNVLSLLKGAINSLPLTINQSLVL